MNRVAFGVLGAFALIATPAFAVSDDVPVNVNITVAENVSIWTGNSNSIESVALVLDGQDGNNFDGHASTIQYITNVAAKLLVRADSDITNVGGGQGIWFYLFPNQNDVNAARAALTPAAYAPPGGLVWGPNGQPSGHKYGHTYDLGLVSPNNSVQQMNVVYGAATPGELPAPTSANVQVVYTITSNI